MLVWKEKIICIQFYSLLFIIKIALGNMDFSQSGKHKSEVSNSYLHLKVFA